MTINRKAAIDYAKIYWNRACEDDKIGLKRGLTPVGHARISMQASTQDNWDVYFVLDGAGRGENAVFGKTINGVLTFKPDPIFTDLKDHLNDCTHYVSRCLLSGGVRITETSRANELIQALIKSADTKVLAIKTDKDQGQKIIDSGIFQQGDIIGYCLPDQAEYHHSAMYTGPDNSESQVVGGVTCHSVCRYGALTKTWNLPTPVTDDAWYLNRFAGNYTFIHLSEDDPPLAIGTLYGWWQLDKNYYFVASNGTARLARLPPKKGEQPAPHSPVARLIQGANGVVFIWALPHGKIQVEKWSVPMLNQRTTGVQTDAGLAIATRMF